MKVLSQLRSKDQNWISLRNFKINIFNSTAGINFVTNKTILKKLSQPLPNIVCDQRWSEQMNPTMTGYIIDLEDIKIYKKCVQLPTSMETDEPEYICNRIFTLDKKVCPTCIKQRNRQLQVQYSCIICLARDNTDATLVRFHAYKKRLEETLKLKNVSWTTICNETAENIFKRHYEHLLNPARRVKIEYWIKSGEDLSGGVDKDNRNIFHSLELLDNDDSTQSTDKPMEVAVA